MNKEVTMDASDKEAIDEIMANFSRLNQRLKDQSRVILRLISKLTHNNAGFKENKLS